MTRPTYTWAEEIVEAAGTALQVVRGGSGEPLLILHEEMGHNGWLRFHEELARGYTLHIPSHPGFGKSDRLDWIMTVRDLAGWYLQALDDLRLDHVNVIGLSLGGWLAAEMAAMCPHRFKKLVLVGAPGIQPSQGEIFDMFLAVAREYITVGYLDPITTPEFQQVCPDNPSPEQVEAWEVAREEACRLTWKPYMHDPALPHLLRGVRGVPTMIIWGMQDATVPLSVGQLYHQSIEGSLLRIVENCGHHPEVEKPDQFVRLVQEFLSED